ncbi:hypothetical protein [Maledivibacter halophilus]|uniref:ABC-2 family transporter protein n=1 Tax=Maledivibacter halophilus TaxID=36842 RepID=A0A1T5KQD3_9FIRM|nr:hypothetical protein [Maledivibacter halophilus]SKC65498.1 hypothetical protein SAMN02194393_02013 [Maledivibacter halophilus]
MLNLIKYEFVKKYKMFMIVIITTILAGIFTSLKFEEMGIPIFAVILSIGLFILYAVDVVQMYSQDINRKTGYMVFMTPNSGYTIIGSKVITALLEGFAMLIFFILVITLNSTIVHGIGEVFNMNFHNIDIPFNEVIINIFIFLTAVLLMFIEFLLTIYSAITIRKSILSNVKFKGLISFGIFLLLNYITGKIHTIPYNVLDYSNYEPITKVPQVSDMLNIFAPAMVTAIVLCGLLTLLSGYLLEKKINL